MEGPIKTDTATRSDLDTLTALNHAYIQSVQHGDVQRFDEILAEDFLCSNPDEPQTRRLPSSLIRSSQLRRLGIAPAPTIPKRVLR